MTFYLPTVDSVDEMMRAGLKNDCACVRRGAFRSFDNEKYGGERGRSQAMFVYKMELRDAVCERFQSTEIL